MYLYIQHFNRPLLFSSVRFFELQYHLAQASLIAENGFELLLLFLSLSG